MGFGIETNEYFGSKILGGHKPQETATSAFSGRKEQSMDEALQANSIHVAAAKTSPAE